MKVENEKLMLKLRSRVFFLNSDLKIWDSHLHSFYLLIAKDFSPAKLSVHFLLILLISQEENECPDVFTGKVEVYLNKIYIAQVLPRFSSSLSFTDVLVLILWPLDQIIFR
jgi:hypothetical protein